ncbi:unnamed protein product [Knipowitschia caucasica]
MMDVSWTTTPRPEPFKRPNPADTLTRLASFIARAESKTGLSRSHRLPPPPQPAPCLNQIYRPPQLPQPAQSLPYPCVESHPGLSQLYMPPQTLQLAPSLPYPCAELNPSLNQIYRPLQTLPSLNQIYRTPNPPQPALNLPYPYVDLGPSLNQIYRPQQAPPSLPYQDCSLQFTYPTQLLTHQDLQHNLPKPYRCQHCLQEFSHRSTLQMHSCQSAIHVPFQATNSPIYATSLTNVPESPIESFNCTQPVSVSSIKSTHNLFENVPCAQPSPVDIKITEDSMERVDSTPCNEGIQKTEIPTENLPCVQPTIVGVSPFAQEQVPSHQEAGNDIIKKLETNSPEKSLTSDDDSSSSQYMEGEGSCKFCSRVFSDETACQQHAPSKPCDKREESPKRQTKKCLNGVFSCRSCDMVFNSTTKLYNHRKEIHSRGVPSTIEKKPIVKRHRKPNSRPYTCQICSKVFFHHLSLWAHSRQHPKANGDVKTVKTAPSKDIKPLQSRLAGKLETPYNEKKLAPIKLTLRKNAWTKDISVDMKTVPKLRITAWKDRAVKKKVGGESLEEEEEFACASCPEVFAQLSELLAHAELHQTATVRGSCSVCTCEMDASSQWAEKMRLYHCGLCQRGFVALENFLSHCQEHLKNKVEDEGISEAIICEKS